MHKIPQLDTMSNEERLVVLRDYPEFLSKISKQAKVTKATASRVFAGKIQRSPKVRAVINRELSRIYGKEQYAA